MIDMENVGDCPKNQQSSTELNDDMWKLAMLMFDLVGMLELMLEAEDQTVGKKGPTGDDCILHDRADCIRELREILEEAREIIKKYN